MLLLVLPTPLGEASAQYVAYACLVHAYDF
jgi:hypothetical protein